MLSNIPTFGTAKIVVGDKEYPCTRVEMGMGMGGDFGSVVVKAESRIENAVIQRERSKDLIDFAKSGAPPVHRWVDTNPTYAATLAARDVADQFGGFERCVPRRRDQGPWLVDSGDITPDRTAGPSHGCKRAGGFVDSSCLELCDCHNTLRFAKSKRPVSLSDFAIDFHASNQRWWTDLHTGERIDRNLGEMIMLVTSEIAEAMEGERKDLMDDHLPHRKMVEVELADAIIRIADIVGSFGRDHADTFAKRVAYVASSDISVPENKGAALKRICDPLASIDGGDRPYRRHFTANKLARVWHRIERYTEKHGYDLWGAVFEKMKYNEARVDHTPEARKAANGKKF